MCEGERASLVACTVLTTIALLRSSYIPSTSFELLPHRSCPLCIGHAISAETHASAAERIVRKAVIERHHSAAVLRLQRRRRACGAEGAPRAIKQGLVLLSHPGALSPVTAIGLSQLVAIHLNYGICDDVPHVAKT